MTNDLDKESCSVKSPQIENDKGGVEETNRN